MSVTRSRGRHYAELGMTIIRADGARVALGAVSNRPVIGRIQNWLRDRRIKKYIDEVRT